MKRVLTIIILAFSVAKILATTISTDTVILSDTIKIADLYIYQSNTNHTIVGMRNCTVVVKPTSKIVFYQTISGGWLYFDGFGKSNVKMNHLGNGVWTYSLSVTNLHDGQYQFRTIQYTGSSSNLSASYGTRCNVQLFFQTTDKSSCSLIDDTIRLVTNRPKRWEKSTNGGTSWSNIACLSRIFTESNPTAGVVKYRALNRDNTYSDIVTITYVDAVPSTIQALPATTTKTVDESITFTADVVDNGYSYQWKKDGTNISGAKSRTYTISKIKTSHAGNYTCDVSNGCNGVTTSTARLNVNKCAQVIDFPEIPTLTYSTGLTYTLPQKTDKGLTILYQSMDATVATVSGNVVTIKAPGSTIITATQTGDANYLEATPVSRTLVVNKRTQTITFDSIPEKTYEDLPFTLPQKTNEGLTISYRSTNTSVATVSGNTVTIKKPGTTEIIASQAGDATRYPAAEVSQTLVVKKATQYITFGTLNNKTYGDAPFALNEVSSKNLPIKYVSSDTAVASINGNMVTIKKPGTTLITASQAGNAYYLPADSVSQSFTVNKANQVINFPSINSMPYGSADLSLAELTDKGEPITYVSSDTTIATIIDNHVVHITGAGTTNISASQMGNDYFNPAQAITQVLTVTKANQVINFPAIPACTFGQDTFSLVATVNSGLEIVFESSNDAVASVSGRVVTIVGAGQCFITASAPGNKNYYTATSVEQALVVNKAQPVIEFTTIEGEHTYGDDPIALSASSDNGEVTFTSSNPSKLFIFGGNAIIQGAGTFTITASLDEDANHLAASASQVITVNKASLTVAADNLSRTYGDANPDLTYAISGFVNGDTNLDLTSTISISTTATSTSAVGTYEISPVATVDDNYSITCRKGVLTIEKASLVISTQASREYGENNPDFEYTYTGFKNNETSDVLTTLPQSYTTAKRTSSVGTYPVYISGAAATNYNISYETSSLIVEQAPLTITALDATRKRLQPNPEFQLSIVGFKLNDSISSLEQLPTIQCAADINSPAGTYPIVLLNDGHATNYSYTLVNGTLTVEKLTYTIVVNSQDDSMGTTSGTGMYDEEATITISATPAQHYHFVSWNDGTTDNPRTIRVTADVTYTALFAINQYVIAASANDGAMGSVSGGGTFDYGTTITLTATPNEGYQFNRWTDNNTDNPRQITVTENKFYKAEFGLKQCVVNVSTSDYNMGVVSGGGIYDYGTNVELRATPNSGYVFSHWSNGETTNPYIVTLTSDLSIEAFFKEDTDALDDIHGDSGTTIQKILLDGKIYILRGEKVFTVEGQEVR